MEVLNKYHFGNRVPDGAVSIMRGSLFGNPFVIGKDGNRPEVIRKYRIWLWEKMQDKHFCDRILALEGYNLCCCCKPAACHGDVLKAAFNYLKEKN